MQTNGVENLSKDQSLGAGAAALAKEKIAAISDGAQALTAQICSFTNEKKSQIASAASDPRVQVAAASGAGGAVVVGTGGAGVGLLAGGTVGVALGIVPAVFTLGLSIPVFGAIGAGCGAAAGGAVGGAVGFTGAGTIGYHAYAKRTEIHRLLSRLRLQIETSLGTKEEEEEAVDLSPVSQDLAEIAAKLNATDTSLTPWADIKDLREQLGAVQQSVGQQMEEAGKPQKRRSLSNLSEKLTEMNTSLDSAESSWTPWTDLTYAKQHLGRAQDIAAQPNTKLVGA